MTSSIFDPQLRVIACIGCASPIKQAAAQAQPPANHSACPRCGAANSIASRNDQNDWTAAQQPAQQTEAQRFQTLRSQDGTPLRPPPALLSLLSGSGLAQQGSAVAWDQWKQARHELQNGGPFTSVERLFFLTLMLFGQLAKARQDEQVRALLESALDLLTEPAHRATLHGMLARSAVRANDMAAAQHWLSLCPPHSSDIHADSAFRLSAAYVATAQQQYPRVIELLGSRIDDVPIADSNDLVCGVLRANALEKLGKMDEAAAQLSRWLESNGAAVQSIISSNSMLAMCPQSLMRASQQQQQLQQNVVRTTTSMNFGPLIGVTVAGGIAIPLIAGAASQFGGESIMSIVLPIALIGFTALVGLFVFNTLSKGSRAKKRLAQQGVRATATLVELNHTGVRINDQPQMQLRLKVETPGQPTFIALHNQVIPHHQLHQMQPGALLPVMYDAADRSQLVIAQG